MTTDFVETDGFLLMPGLGAFVGGDVLMGMIASGAFESDEVTAFIDVGTNGEMAVGSRDGILAGGTAAVSAFEVLKFLCYPYCLAFFLILAIALGGRSVRKSDGKVTEK